MMRRLVGVFALAMVATTGAQAQFTATFKATPGAVGGNTDFAAYFGQFTAGNPAELGVNLGDGTANIGNLPNVFQIFCVDETHFFHNNDQYQVWVTPMSASDFSHTRLGAGSGALYFEAANIASNMQFAYPGGPDNATTDNLEYSIWKVLGYPTPPVATEDPTSDYNAATVNSDIATFGSGQGIFANQWLVITALNLRTNDKQEFIYNGPGRPQQTVPEPGTMGLVATGLVGMMGAGMRRRKNRK